MSRSKAEVDKLRAEMKRAVRYRDGPGMMNTIYLGGMASAAMYSRLGSSMTKAMRDKKSFQDLIDEASDGQIEDAWEYKGFQWILGHYRKAGSKLYRFETKAIEID